VAVIEEQSTRVQQVYSRRLRNLIARTEYMVPKRWNQAFTTVDPLDYWYTVGVPALETIGDATVSLTRGYAQAETGSIAQTGIDLDRFRAGLNIMATHTREDAQGLGSWLGGQHSRDLQWIAGETLDASRPDLAKVRTPNPSACDFCRTIATRVYNNINEVSVHASCRCGWGYINK